MFENLVLNDGRVLVKRFMPTDLEKTEKDGTKMIYKLNPFKGKVLKVADSVENIQPNDIVYFEQGNGYRIDQLNSEYLVFKVSDIVAIEKF